MSVSAGIASLNAAIGIAKGLRGLEKAYDEAVLKGQLIELMGSLNDAKAELLEAQEAIGEREREIARLSEALQVRGELIEGPGGYRWPDRGGGLKIGYPLCPACLLKGHQVQMLQKGGHHTAACANCGHTAAPVECYLEPDSSGSQLTVREAKEADQARNREAEKAMFRRLGRDLA